MAKKRPTDRARNSRIIGRSTVPPALHDPDQRAEWKLPKNQTVPGPYMVELGAKEAKLSKAGTAYMFGPGKWLNLDGNQVIINGGPPSGSHSDIIYPHTAWAALAAAGIG